MTSHRELGRFTLQTPIERNTMQSKYSPPAKPAHLPASRPATAKVATQVTAKAAEPTLAQAINEKVDQAATHILMREAFRPENSKLSREKVRSQLWQFPEGVLLRDLARSRFGKMPRSKAEAAILTSEDGRQWSEAMRVFRHGIEV